MISKERLEELYNQLNSRQGFGFGSNIRLFLEIVNRESSAARQEFDAKLLRDKAIKSMNLGYPDAAICIGKESIRIRNTSMDGEL